MVEHLTENQGVPSSSLGFGTPGGSGSVVEHLLAKQRVAGSNPVFRSNFLRSKRCSGDVAKWQGRGLQNLYSPVRIRPSPLVGKQTKGLIAQRKAISPFWCARLQVMRANSRISKTRPETP